MNNKKRDKHLAKAIENLPEFPPEENLWEEISQGLENETPELRKRKFEPMRLVAAVLLLISVSLIVQYFLREQQAEIHFGEELSELEVSTVSGTGLEDDFAIFLSEECTEYREICEMPEFKLLMSQLTEIRTEVIGIDQMIESTGFDEILYKAKSKADKESNRIKKEIVKLLRG